MMKTPSPGQENTENLCSGRGIHLMHFQSIMNVKQTNHTTVGKSEVVRYLAHVVLSANSYNPTLQQPLYRSYQFMHQSHVLSNNPLKGRHL